MALSSNTLPNGLTRQRTSSRSWRPARHWLLPRVFASDLHKSSVTCQGSAQDDDKPPELGSGAIPALPPADPEVMDIEEDPDTRPDPLSE
jgi:hypothetical protein